MSNNRMPKKTKQVRDMKGQGEPVPVKTTIDIIPGNATVLTVKFLNQINENLIEIKELLKSGRPQ